MKVTRKQMYSKVEGLQKQGIDIAIGTAYGGMRCTNKSESRDLSPRLSTSEMSLWLNGFQTALNETGFYERIIND